MYISMTGFSSTSIERDWGTLTLDLASVNHRYQEIYVRLPKEIASWEPWFHRKLRGLFRRGKVQARVEILWASSTLAVSIDREVLAAYYREISEIRDSIGEWSQLGQLGQSRDISLDALVNLPGVLNMQERSKLARDEETEGLFDELLERGAAAWNEMRRTEGGHLARAIEAHLAELEQLVREIDCKWLPAKDAAFAAMTERINRALEAAGADAVDAARMAQEAVIIADRWDISEEIAQLGSHVLKFRETGDASESVGRKLDFLVQEMNREINTINSKVADAEIRWLSVEAKTALERIREQIQNLE